MKALDYTALTFIIIGALNWLLIGLFQFNLVDFIFGASSILGRIVYSLVGIAGIYSLSIYSRISEK